MSLQETLDNQAKKYGYDRFIDMLLNGEVDMVDIEEPMKEYARECCRASLVKAAENACTGVNERWDIVDEDSITDPSNIVLL